MIGTTVSHFKILEELGRGGMGVVYRAQDTRLGRMVALKFLPPESIRDPAAKERFALEARAAAALMHPAVAAVFEFGEAGDTGFIAMEYLEGETLDRVLERGALPVERAVEFTVALADGLALAHRRGVVHRDLKPGNIMVLDEPAGAKGGRIKILDFGLARISAEPGRTTSGTLIGTLSYMSPEQVAGAAVDHRTDIFSLGAVLYEMLSGGPPFPGDHEAAILYGVVNEDPKPLRGARAAVPARLEEIVFRALEKDPERRYRDMGEVLADLADYQYRPQTLSRAAPAGSVSVAVLPFADISPGRGNEFLADGMTDELVLALSRTDGLRVIARTSVGQYKGRAADIRRIGRELGVGHVVEGSVRRYGDALRVNASLVDVEAGSPVWGERFEGTMDDIFSFQDEVARKVSRALSTELGGPPGAGRERAARSVKAYEYYVEGKVLLDAPNLQNLDRAVEALERAHRLDPAYAPALGVLSNAYLWYVDTGLRPDPEYLDRAGEYAERALAIDAGQPSARYALANLALKRGEVEEAFEGFGRVLESDPNHGDARMWRTYLLLSSSRAEEALREATVMLSRDPFSPLAHWLHSTIRLHQGMFDAAVAEYEQVVAEVPTKLAWLALAYRYAGRMEAARDAERRLGELEPGGVLWKMARAFLAGAEGRTDEVIGLVDDAVRAFSWDFFICTYWTASLYAMAGRSDEAFRWLDRAVDLGMRNHRWFEVDPNLDGIRGDPRYPALLERARAMAARIGGGDG